MRAVLTMAIFALLATGASAEDARLPYAADGTLNHHSRAARLHAEEFLCRKDHAGLQLASAEPAADARERLSKARKSGGVLIVARIEEIDCAYCAAAIERSFASRNEVAAVSFNVHKRTLSIVTKPSGALGDQTIRRIIARRGYELSEVRRE